MEDNFPLSDFEKLPLKSLVCIRYEFKECVFIISEEMVLLTVTVSVLIEHQNCHSK